MININNYCVVLLSAGTGSGLGEFTKNKPKSLLKVRGVSLLSRIVNILQKRKLKKVSLIVGFKSYQIVKELKNFKGIEFNYIKIKDYKVNGHACSWHAFKDKWMKIKKPILLIHTDIYFDELYLDNIIKNKKKNIIGVHSNNKLYRNDSIMVNCNKDNKVESLNFLKQSKFFVGEVLGINKISKNTSKNLFLFMDNFLINDNKKLSWEFMLNYFIDMYRDKFYAINNQTYIWKNVNYIKDYRYLIKNVK